MSNKTKTSSSFFNMVVTLVLIAVLSAFVLAKVELFTKEPIQKPKTNGSSRPFRKSSTNSTTIPLKKG
ncbi:MAG: hypothetical protein ACLU99_07640 [Alphaproteobacteria bacterium]